MTNIENSYTISWTQTVLYQATVTAKNEAEAITEAKRALEEEGLAGMEHDRSFPEEVEVVSVQSPPFARMTVQQLHQWLMSHPSEDMMAEVDPEDYHMALRDHCRLVFAESADNCRPR